MNHRLSAVVALAFLVLSIGCGTSSRRPLSCQEDAGCPSGSYCVAGACVAGLLPEAHIRIAGGELVSHREVLFDGSGSVDPNPQHRLTSYRWAVKRASAAACDPSPATGSADTLATIFRCAGDYQVELSVENSLGLQSAAIAQAVSVGPSANAPVIDAQSPDLVLQHRCAGTPLACEALADDGAAALPLFVSAHDVEDGDALSYRWEVDPPAGADPSSVTFEPDASARNPTVRLRATGGRLAGVWTLRALVTDGDALTTPAEIQVTVGNTPPAVEATAPRVVFPHRYEQNVFRASGVVKLLVTDADGDLPAPPEVHLTETAATQCQASFPNAVAKDGATEVSVSLTCPSAGDLSPVIGQTILGAGVERELAFVVDDGQGGTATIVLPFDVTDTPPAFAAAEVTVGHRVESCPLPGGACFVATGGAPPIVDPDGDEVSLVGFTGAALDQSMWSADATAFSIRTDVRYPLSFRTAAGLSPAAVSATLQDPWRTTSAPFQVRITNQPPVASGLALAPVVTYTGAAYLAQATAAAFTDPEGDPLGAVQGTGCPVSLAGGVVQATCSTPFDWTTGAPVGGGAFVGTPIAVAASVADPWARSAAVLSTVTPRAPGVAPTVGAVAPARGVCYCDCVGTRCTWSTGSGTCSSYAFTPNVSSPAGVPVRAHVQASAGTVDVNCLAGACTGSLAMSVCGPTSVWVTASDGWSTTNTQVITVEQRCPTEGQACTGSGGGGGGGTIQ